MHFCSDAYISDLTQSIRSISSYVNCRRDISWFIQGAAERTPRFGKLIKTKPTKINFLLNHE
jgi:hypothetical protein